MLDRFPLVDGHNDLPWEIRAQFGGDLEAIDLTGRVKSTQTDLLRLAESRVGGQFWSVCVPGRVTGDEAVRVVLEQVDLVHRMVQRHTSRLSLALTASDVEDARCQVPC